MSVGASLTLVDIQAAPRPSFCPNGLIKNLRPTHSPRPWQRQIRIQLTPSDAVNVVICAQSSPERPIFMLPALRLLRSHKRVRAVQWTQNIRNYPTPRLSSATQLLVKNPDASGKLIDVCRTLVRVRSSQPSERRREHISGDGNRLPEIVVRSIHQRPSSVAWSPQTHSRTTHKRKLHPDAMS